MKRFIISVGIIVGFALTLLLGLYVKQIINETVQSRTPGQQYIVSLGDSVAAGAGLSNTGNRRSDGCDLAANASPYLLGTQLHESVVQFACSGATIATTGANSLLGTQLVMARPYVSGSDVVIYAGANDIGWLQLLTGCTKSNCATEANRLAVSSKLNQLQHNLESLLDQIRLLHPHRVLVNTYYQLLSDGDTCFESFGITPEKVSFINAEEEELNSTIAATAAKSGATVVHIDFGGHTLCSRTAWIQGTTANAPLHPTAAGQQQIADQDTAVLSASSR